MIEKADRELPVGPVTLMAPLELETPSVTEINQKR